MACHPTPTGTDDWNSRQLIYHHGDVVSVLVEPDCVPIHLTQEVGGIALVSIPRLDPHCPGGGLGAVIGQQHLTRNKRQLWVSNSRDGRDDLAVLLTFPSNCSKVKAFLGSWPTVKGKEGKAFPISRSYHMSNTEDDQRPFLNVPWGLKRDVLWRRSDAGNVSYRFFPRGSISQINVWWQPPISRRWDWSIWVERQENCETRALTSSRIVVHTEQQSIPGRRPELELDVEIASQSDISCYHSESPTSWEWLYNTVSWTQVGNSSMHFETAHVNGRTCNLGFCRHFRFSASVPAATSLGRTQHLCASYFPFVVSMNPNCLFRNMDYWCSWPDLKLL